MSSVNHHDQSRNQVSGTAFAVAKAREIETNKIGGLINDPFAKFMITEEVEKALASIPRKKKETLVAVRTRKIDELMIKSLQEINQIVVVGAGLDCRPWRLNSYLSTEKEKETLYQQKTYYEIDFPEIFAFKLKQLEEFEPCFNYQPIHSNVCLDDWGEQLLSKGFDPLQPTLWLLEGFVGYLTSEELEVFLNQLTQLSQVSSTIIATFVGSTYESYTSMHRFRHDQPLEYLKAWNWLGECWDFKTLCEHYQQSLDENWSQYYLVSVHKK